MLNNVITIVMENELVRKILFLVVVAIGAYVVQKVACKAIKHLHEIFAGHIRDSVGNAVAPAVLAMQVTTQRTFPKEIRQRVRLDLVMTVEAVRLEREFFPKSKMHQTPYRG